jgi:hypothetical protein
MKKSELRQIIREEISSLMSEEKGVVDYAKKLAQKFSSLGASPSTMGGVGTMSSFGLWKNPKGVVIFDNRDSLEKAWETIEQEGTPLTVQKTYSGTAGDSVKYVKMDGFLITKNIIVGKGMNSKFYLGIFTPNVLKNRAFKK